MSKKSMRPSCGIYLLLLPVLFHVMPIAALGQPGFSYAQLEQGKLFFMARAVEGYTLLMGDSLTQDICKTFLNSKRSNGLHVKWQQRGGYAFSLVQDPDRISMRVRPLIFKDTALARIEKLALLDSLTKVKGDEIRALGEIGYYEQILPFSFLTLPSFKCDTNNIILSFYPHMNRELLDIAFREDTLYCWYSNSRTSQLWYRVFAGFKLDDPSSVWTLKKCHQQSTLLDQLGPSASTRSIKLIIQGDNYFLICLSTGQIFHIGNQIELVGALEKGDGQNPNSIGKLFLIEDVPNGVVLTNYSAIRKKEAAHFPVFKKTEVSNVGFYFILPTE